MKEEALVSANNEKSKTFFALPAAEKDKLGWKTPEANRGYVAPGENTFRLTNLGSSRILI